MDHEDLDLKTSKRDNNGEVQKLGDKLAEVLRNGRSNLSVPAIEKLVSQVILDFNLLIASPKEITKWQKCIQRLTSLRGDLFAVIFKALIIQTKTFHDKSEYNDFGHKRDILPKTIVDGLLGNAETARKINLKTIDSIREFCVKLVKVQPLQQPFSQQYYALFKYILSHHPNASRKLKGLVGITVEVNEQYKGRVLTLLYDKSERDDGLEKDDVSFIKCLNYIYDPNVDGIRDILVDYIFRQFHLYINTRSSIMIDIIKQQMPPPEFQQNNGQYLEPKRTHHNIVNYVKFILSLMRKTMIPIPAADKPTSTGVKYAENADMYRVFKELQYILIDYLHIMETEKTNSKKPNAKPNPSLDPMFQSWLREKRIEFAEFLRAKRDQFTIDQWKKANEDILNERLMYQKYLDVHSEEELHGPVPIKLDAVFCLVSKFYTEELGKRKGIALRRSVFDKYFKDLSQMLGIVDDPTAQVDEEPPASPLISPWSNSSRPSSPMSAASGGVLGSDGLIISEDEDVQSMVSFAGDQLQTSQSKRINVNSVIFGHLYNEFEKCCLSGGDSPVMPSLFFGILNADFNECNDVFLQGLCDALKVKDIKYKERAVSFLIGYCCRARRLSVAHIQSVLVRLTEELLNQTSPARKLSRVLFSGVMEIICARWRDLQEEFETSKLVRIIMILAHTAQKFNLLKQLKPMVATTFHKKLQRFDMSHHAQVNEFLTNLIDSQKNQKLVWPVRPFDPIDLRNFSSLVNASDMWIDCWKQANMEDETSVNTIELGKEIAEQIWTSVSVSVPVNTTPRIATSSASTMPSIKTLSTSDSRPRNDPPSTPADSESPNVVRAELPSPTSVEANTEVEQEEFPATDKDKPAEMPAGVCDKPSQPITEQEIKVKIPSPIIRQVSMEVESRKTSSSDCSSASRGEQPINRAPTVATGGPQMDEMTPSIARVDSVVEEEAIEDASPSRLGRVVLSNMVRSMSPAPQCCARQNSSSECSEISPLRSTTCDSERSTGDSPFNTRVRSSEKESPRKYGEPACQCTPCASSNCLYRKMVEGLLDTVRNQQAQLVEMSLTLAASSKRRRKADDFLSKGEC